MSEACDDLELKGVQPAKLPEQEAECCDTETIRKIPDELREPKDQVPSEEPLKTPQPINIYNHDVTAVCKDPLSEGEPVTTPDGTFSTKFYFSSILSLTEDVLARIAEARLEPLLEQRIHEQSIDAEDLRRITGMTLAQADELLDKVFTIQAQQDDYALELAESKLVCYYWNTPQTARCVDDEMAKPEDHPDAVFEATVPAHTYKSTVSQADANRQALEAARAMLNCFYLNDPVEVDCQTRPDRPMDVMEPVPNDSEPVYPGRELRVGHVTVKGGLFTSYSSKEDANQKALEFGLSQLVCWYPNDPIHLDCGDPDARAQGVDPSKEPIAIADPVTRKRGQIVDIPRGFIISELSTEAATDEAQALAESLLECCYINDELVLTCEPDPIIMPGLDEEGHELVVYKEASPSVGVNTVSIRAGAYTSCVSKEEANLIARQMSEGLLDCQYCNLRVMPLCVPAWVTEGVLNGLIELPLNKHNVITDGRHSMSLSDLPPEATFGMGANEVCNPVAQQAQNVANSAGDAKATGEDCVYFNDTVYVSCAAVDPITEEEVLPGVLHYGNHPDTGEAYVFYTMYSSDVCLAYDFSHPDGANKYITAPAGMVKLTGKDKKEEANKQALAFAMSMLVCMWTNPEIRASCSTADLHQSICDDVWLLGPGITRLSYLKQLVSWSNTASHPVYIPRGYILFLGEGGDEKQAQDTIWQAVQSYGGPLITCVYTNKAYVAVCESEGSYVEAESSGIGWQSTTYKYINSGSLGQVSAYTVFASSPDAANILAMAVAKSIASCDENTVTIMTFTEASPSKPSPTPPPPPPPSPSPSSPGSDPGPKPSPSHKPTPPPKPVPSGCCYPACPFFKAGKDTNPNQQQTNQIMLMNAIDISEKSVRLQMGDIGTVIENIDSTISSLETKTDKMLQEVDNLLAKLQ